MKVIVASTNPIKIKATQTGFNAIFPDKEIFVKGTSGSSGVSDQPITNIETYQGALNRAKRIQQTNDNADYWIGIEGGIEQNSSNGFDAFAWVVILSKDQIGQSRSASFSLPPKIVDLINQGYELGDADDIVFKQKNTKQKSGAVGLLTNDAITRSDFYAPAVTLALIPFKNKDLYPQKIPVFNKTG